MSIIIEMENVRKTYDGKNFVLDNLCFSARQGELVVIKGKSGSAKSTLLNILGLLDTFDYGRYELNNSPINPKKHNMYSDLRSRYIGFIFQAYHLIDSISIQDNILLPYLYTKEPINEDVITKMNDILDSFNLIELKNKKVKLLSGGEKQRVAIARAIIKNPPIIIADEPTGNLDDENSAIVINHLKTLTEQNTTIILVTHDMNLMKYGDSTYSLQEGRLI